MGSAMVHLTWGVLGVVAGLCPSPRAITGLEVVPLVIMDLLLVQTQGQLSTRAVQMLLANSKLKAPGKPLGNGEGIGGGW